MKAPSSSSLHVIAGKSVTRFRKSNADRGKPNGRVSFALFALVLVTLAISIASSAIAATRPKVKHTASPLQIVVLSNRADLISGGDALVQIVLPTGIKPS